LSCSRDGKKKNYALVDILFLVSNRSCNGNDNKTTTYLVASLSAPAARTSLEHGRSHGMTSTTHGCARIKVQQGVKASILFRGRSFFFSDGLWLGGSSVGVGSVAAAERHEISGVWWHLVGFLLVKEVGYESSVC
jgi:hypothetical protein